MAAGRDACSAVSSFQPLRTVGAMDDGIMQDMAALRPPAESVRFIQAGATLDNLSELHTTLKRVRKRRHDGT